MIVFDVKRINDAVRFLKTGERWQIKSGLYVLGIEKDDQWYIKATMQHLAADKFAWEMLASIDLLDHSLDWMMRELAGACEGKPTDEQ